MSGTNIMKWVTIKFVGITAFFLVTYVPFDIAFAHTLFVTPTTTSTLDMTAALLSLHAPFQPMIYIMAFSKLRKAFLKPFCSVKKETLNTAVEAP